MSATKTTIDLANCRVLRVEDTRDRDFDSGKPIPGTGDTRPCDHCGRRIDIHATVETRDGAQYVVGTGCLGASYRAETAKRVATEAWRARKADLADRLGNDAPGTRWPEAVIARNAAALDVEAWRVFARNDAYRATRRAREAAIIRELS